MPSLFLVRHGVALDQGEWTMADELRPLTEFGWRQAVAIGRIASQHRVSHFYSSPAVRCLDTLLPAAHLRGVTVEAAPELFETEEPRGLEAAGQLLRRLLDEYLPAGRETAAACSHGNVLVPLLDAAGLRDPSRCPKGGVWRLQVEPGQAEVRVSSMGHLSPRSQEWER